MYIKWLQGVFLTFCIGGIMFLSYLLPSDLGKGFVVAVLYMMLRYVAIAGGFVLLFIYILFQRKISFSLFFIFIATLNIAICLAAVALYFSHFANREWLHDCLLNGLLGTGMTLCTQLKKR